MSGYMGTVDQTWPVTRACGNRNPLVFEGFRPASHTVVANKKSYKRIYNSYDSGYIMLYYILYIYYIYNYIYILYIYIHYYIIHIYIYEYIYIYISL